MAWYDELAPLGTPMGLLALLSTGAGIGSNIYEGQRARGDYEKTLRAMQQPLDPNQYYTPMTAMEHAALTRSIKGDLASRNVPMDGAYTTALTSELLAKNETQRWLAALQAAQAQRSGLLGAYQMRPQTRGMGDISALPAYLQMMNLQRQRQGYEAQNTAQQQEWMNFLKTLYGGAGGAQGSGMDLYNASPAMGNFQGDILSPTETFVPDYSYPAY